MCLDVMPLPSACEEGALEIFIGGRKRMLRAAEGWV